VFAVNFKNSNTPYFYGMMLATTAGSGLPFFYRNIFYRVECVSTRNTSTQERSIDMYLIILRADYLCNTF